MSERPEDLRLRMWRWIGGELPPGMWQMGPTPADIGTARDGSEIEICYFVPEEQER